MVGYLVVIGAGTIVIAALAVIGFAGFRNGDFTGEAMARALLKDLKAATPGDREPGRN